MLWAIIIRNRSTYGFNDCAVVGHEVESFKYLQMSFNIHDTSQGCSSDNTVGTYLNGTDGKIPLLDSNVSSLSINKSQNKDRIKCNIYCRNSNEWILYKSLRIVVHYSKQVFHKYFWGLESVGLYIVFDVKQAQQ